MKITMYELLGLVKDGKAPKKIRYNEKTYYYDRDFINYVCDLDDGDTLYLLEDIIEELVSQLNYEVEIIEEEKKFTKEDFIKETMDLEGLTREEFNKIYEVKECNCGRAFCKGFIKVEKVQEEKKIPEKIKDKYCSQISKVELAQKINEIIDYLESQV